MNVELITLTSLRDEVIDAPSSPQLSINLQLTIFKVAPVEKIAPHFEDTSPEQFKKVTLFNVNFELVITAEPALKKAFL